MGTNRVFQMYYTMWFMNRLAIAYGLLRSKAPATIRAVKNLRICGDFHE